MKKTLKFLYIILNLLFLSISILIVVNAFTQNEKLLLVAGIITFIAFLFSLTHFILSKIFKIKIALYTIYLFFLLAGFSTITIAIFTKLKLLKYVAYIILALTYPLGFFFRTQ